MRWTTRTAGVQTAATVAVLAAALLLAAAGRLAAQCTIAELCSSNSLPTGACGYIGTNCVPPPSTGLCAANGVGQCSGTYNCVPPTATAQGVQILAGSGGTFTARLPLDVQAPFNSWATLNFPNSVLQAFWYSAATVPDICDASSLISTCQFAGITSAGGTATGADHVSTWIDEAGLTCAGAPYSFTVSALLSTCQQPSCFCEQEFGTPNCSCFASTRTKLNGLTINVAKSMLPGCVPPPDFCGEQGGAAGGVGSAGGGSAGDTGGWLKDLGSKGNGPDSGAAGTTGGGGGGGGGQCKTCLAAGSSSGDGSGCSASAGGGGASCTFGASGGAQLDQSPEHQGGGVEGRSSPITGEARSVAVSGESA
jgi:hypothetical protein